MSARCHPFRASVATLIGPLIALAGTGACDGQRHESAVSYTLDDVNRARKETIRRYLRSTEIRTMLKTCVRDLPGRGTVDLTIEVGPTGTTVVEPAGLLCTLPAVPGLADEATIHVPVIR